MPQIRMLAQLDVLFARADRQQLESRLLNDVRKIRIGDQLHPVSAAGQRLAQANHRMNVAIAADRGNDELCHEISTDQSKRTTSAELNHKRSQHPNFACHYKARGRQWKWRFCSRV